MFGLMTSADLAATQSNNARRQVFHQYPQGAFTLMGLMSLMEDLEEVDKQTFAWHEDRYVLPRSRTAQANATGPWTDTSGASGAVGVDKTAGGWTATANVTTVRIKVVDASIFRVRDVIHVKDAPSTTTAKQFKGIVDAVWPAQNTIDVRCIETVTNLTNTTGGNGLHVTVIGSAAVEGGYSKKGGTTFPIEPSNYTQIFRTPVGPFSRNAIKMGQKFDQSGIYKEYAKKSHIRHMTVAEQACFWGVRGSNTVTDSDDSESKIEKTMGGLYWYLQEYERGTTGNGAHVTYRPNGSDLTTSAWDADDEKRILNFNGGTVTKNEMTGIIERAFFRTSDTGFEKLVCGGSGLLTVFNNYVEANSIKTISLNTKEDTYGMQVTAWETIYGTLYFKSHPLFTEHPAYRYSGFIIDMGSIGYHALQDSDTQLLDNRQANDFDGRKDEWLTEFGLEIKFPERHMYIDDLRGITV